MRIISSISLGIIIFIQSFSWPIGYLWFKVNQDYIAQELCINIEAPELLCAGQCFLEDMTSDLFESQEEKKAQYPPIEKVSSYDLYFEPLELILATSPRLKQQTSFKRQTAYQFLFAPYNFKPPTVS